MNNSSKGSILILFEKWWIKSYTESTDETISSKTIKIITQTIKIQNNFSKKNFPKQLSVLITQIAKTKFFVNKINLKSKVLEEHKMIQIYFKDKINKTHSLKLPYPSLKTENLKKVSNVAEQKVSLQTSVQITLFKA